MNVKNKSIIKPLPDDLLIAEKEKMACEVTEII